MPWHPYFTADITSYFVFAYVTNCDELLHLSSECNELKVELSSLTGESEPMLVRTEPQSEHVVEARNLVFMSSLCITGEGRGIVIRTGGCSSGGKGHAHTHESMAQCILQQAFMTLKLCVLGFNQRESALINEKCSLSC